MAIRTDNQRQNIRIARSDGVSTRASDSKRGKTLYPYGLISSDGLSSRIESREKDNKRQLMKKFIKNHPIAIPYWSVTLLLAFYLQGWINLGG